MIAVLDYGGGNVRSVVRALQRCGVDARLTSNPEEIAAARRLVFPGQGAMPECMDRLRARGLEGLLRRHLEAGKPYLGICLGLQILFERSEEHGGAQGLGVLPGEVLRFEDGRTTEGGRPLKVPHMGWNEVWRTPAGSRHPVVTRVVDGSHFYFVHSYYVRPDTTDVEVLWSDYGHRFTAGVAREGLLAVQFHPEKSQDVGEALLAAWLEETAG